MDRYAAPNENVVLNVDRITEAPRRAREEAARGEGVPAGDEPGSGAEPGQLRMQRPRETLSR
jgi:hypothetical protein